MLQWLRRNNDPLWMAWHDHRTRHPVELFEYPWSRRSVLASDLINQYQLWLLLAPASPLKKEWGITVALTWTPYDWATWWIDLVPDAYRTGLMLTLLRGEPYGPWLNTLTRFFDDPLSALRCDRALLDRHRGLRRTVRVSHL